jgi:serine phosphatase RsbU (regulator of sigma subunit)/ligand-binding sensor domain-containing protein
MQNFGLFKANKVKQVFLLIYVLCTNFSYSQTGNYYITNYTPANYIASDQNRGIIQDKAGKIYVINSSGLLNYDGEYWKKTLLLNEVRGMSMDVDKNGTIFIGGEGEFGQIRSKKNGDLTYNTLTATLNEKEKDFGYLWYTLCAENKVFFCGNNNFFIYDYNKIKRITAPADSAFHTFFNVDDHIFVRQWNVGFSVYLNDNLHFVKGSEQFSDIKVRFIVPKSTNQYWVGTETGLYVMNYNKNEPTNSTFEKVSTPIENWLISNSVYCGKQLSDGNYIIGSQKAGIIHVDKNMNIIKSLDLKNGLQDENVISIFEDNNNNIWLSLNKGVSYIEINSPVTKWGKYDGIKGTIESTCKFKDKIYIATDKGVQYFNVTTSKFELSKIKIGAWELLSHKNNLFIGTDEGVYIFDGKDYTLAIESDVIYRIINDSEDPNILYIGGKDIFVKARLVGNKLTIIDEYQVDADVKDIYEFDGKIFFAVNGESIRELDKKTNKIKVYNEKDGIKLLYDINFFVFDNKLLLGSGFGIFQYNPNSKLTFTRPKINAIFPLNDPITKPKNIFNEVFLQHTGQFENRALVLELTTFSLKENKIKEDKKSLKRIRDVDLKQFYLFDSLVYISTNDGLFCYDLRHKKSQNEYITLISSFIMNEDTILHNLSSNFNEPYKIEFINNEFHFDLSATNFIDEDEMEYAYYLEGISDKYGKWNKNNTISFSNLHEGEYVFHAKSKDVLGHEGKEISFSFTVLPPWYRTTFAYIAYFILFVIVVWIIVALNTKRLRAQNIKLENTITERTKTIAYQMVEIEHKNKEITDSINYAKGIQDSILPDVKEIKQAWADTFVYFQPKDIVSGDFYWYQKINNNEFLIACADCTGHGVPGGFMSMICSDKLHDSAKQSTQPKDILFGTNNGVKATLRQEIMVEGKSKDGMEVCLIKVNTQTQEVSYSGANRLLWIVDGKTKELTEIKPTKASIASFTEFNFEYEQHDFKLKKGDIVYATSDGFPDQFGGSEGKKYMSKKMKAFVLSICDLPMDEQGDLLKKEINDWMIGYEQVDDLLVIGFRL